MSIAKGSKPWEIWIDTGGTFTDCLALDPEGKIQRLKILSSSVIRGSVARILNNGAVELKMNWPVAGEVYEGFVLRRLSDRSEWKIQYAVPADNLIWLKPNARKLKPGDAIELTTNEEVPVLAARLLTRTPLASSFPPMLMKLGSTRGTNAILERKGARTALLITRGFRDLLRIGTQQRPHLFVLHPERPDPLYHIVLEVGERMRADGTTIVPPRKEEVYTIAKRCKAQGITSVAIAFLNSYRNPQHEQMVGRWLKEKGIAYISCSHDLSTQVRLLPRAETAVANAYLDPIIHQYLSRIRERLSGAILQVMTSAGSLVPSDGFFPKDSLLSGPAGGVVGAARAASRSGRTHIIGFDMGGTSTDVSLYNNRFDYRFESKVGALSILSPSLAIETIAAGGGSKCGFDGHRFFVGPESAGASPGPACYGAGGPLTITDVNLLLGRLDPAEFAIPVYPEKSRKALDDLLKFIYKETGRRMRPTAVLESLVQIANEKMAEAIRKISISQGHSPTDFSLLSFGGAGGQHACALADMLGMEEVIIPYDAGLLSAYGIGHASLERFREKLVLEPLAVFEKHFERAKSELFEQARAQFVLEGIEPGRVHLDKCLVFIRFKGQETPLEVEIEKGDEMLPRFRKRYESIFGHWLTREIEVETMRVIARVPSTASEPSPKKPKRSKARPLRVWSMTEQGRKSKAQVYRWESLTEGAQLAGPALLISGNATCYVADGWTADLNGANTAVLKRINNISRGLSHSPEAALELFTNRFTAVAQEMGALLQRTAFSVNVKERLDFSCALLDADGHLVVNAPHIPVHLGSMGVCVRAVAAALPLREGDVAITNHPAFGGSHLPDVTLVKPIFFKGERVGYVANRAHHAEIGGKQPGSMPADATTLQEEGVIIAPTYLVRGGKPCWEDIRQLLTGPPYPTRSIEENLADLNGALASVHLGERSLQTLCERFGAREVKRYMRALGAYADRLLRQQLGKLRGKKKAIELLDDGSKLSVTLQVQKGRLIIDFSGTSPMHPGNLNATPAIVQSVVLYALRVWLERALPMNEGLMQAVELRLPTGMLSPDFTQYQPAVVGGNTELSQRLTDTVLKALDLVACSQGTMNNFLFGNERFGFYETICGGTGAGPGFNGVDAVHHHMTNTRITDAELMELRYPVRVVRFEIRKNSGGKGRWKGGNGIVREVEFLEPLQVNVLTQHRKVAPYGKRGGSPGATGRQWITRANGKRVNLKGMDSIGVEPGDRICIQTPGGGGWG